MSLVSKRGVYQGGLLVWGLAVGGATIAVRSGNAEPYVSPTQLPGQGPIPQFLAAAGLILAGVLVVNQLEKRSWKRAGASANLAPTGSSLLGKPALQGTIDGRTVRATTRKRDTGGGGDEGSSTATFTVIEAELAGPAADGLVLSPSDGSGVGLDGMNVDLAHEATTIGDVAVVGDGDLVAEVVTTRVTQALSSPDRLETVLAGDADDIFLDAIPSADGLVAGALTDRFREGLRDRLPGEPGTVSTEQRGVLLDPAELDAQARAVAAVAESFDRAVAGEAESGTAGGQDVTI